MKNRAGTTNPRHPAIDRKATEMLDVSEVTPVASTLEHATASAKSGGGMARAWSRMMERRRGMATLLGVVASALPGSREPRHLRQRFGTEVRGRLNAAEGERRE